MYYRHNRVYNNFILANEPFAKALRRLETCVLVNNNLCGKLLSSLKPSATFNESFKVTAAPFFVLDFNWLSCELDNFRFKMLYLVILYQYYIKTEYNHNTLTVPFEKSRTVSFVFSMLKYIVASPLLIDFQ